MFKLNFGLYKIKISDFTFFYIFMGTPFRKKSKEEAYTSSKLFYFNLLSFNQLEFISTVKALGLKRFHSNTNIRAAARPLFEL